MNRTLKRLFDYQRFENDSRLGGMIRETETRHRKQRKHSIYYIHL